MTDIAPKFPNGKIECPDCGTTMILEAKRYESAEAMAADVPTQLGHHEEVCPVRCAATHKAHGDAMRANVELQAKLKADANARLLARRAALPPVLTHDQVQAMLEQAHADHLASKSKAAETHASE